MKWYPGENLPKTHARPTFSEAWFNARYGLTFGEKYYSDPIFRTRQDQAARRLLYERFGQAGIGEKDPQPRPHLEVCGHRFLPGLFGCEIIFQDDQAPSCHHLPITSAAELAAIPKPNLETNRWAQEFRRQGATLSSRYRHIDAAINFGGPINGAVTTLGNEGLAYVSEFPKIMRGFLSMIADVCVEAHDKLTAAFDPKAAAGRQLFIGNCPVMMISPASYSYVVLPADLQYRRHIQNFGLHHCGPMDRYLEEYQKLKPIEFIEVGWGSKVEAVHQAFPESKLDLMINIYDLQNMSRPAVHELIAKMVREVGPRECLRDVWVADIGPEVPDDVVLDFVEAVDSAVGPM
jgi:uroporphyrinogen-III decarboxylase